MKKIKDCPFCGGIGELRDEGDWRTIWVQCKQCDAEGGYVDRHDGATEDGAIDKWNNRVEKEIINDIQYLLNMYEAYIDDMGGEAWKDEMFIKFATKYGFTKENLHKGLEELHC